MEQRKMGNVLQFPVNALASDQRDDLLDILKLKEELKRTKLLIDILSDRLKAGVQEQDLFVIRSTLKLSQTKLTSMGEELTQLAQRYLNRYR